MLRIGYDHHLAILAHVLDGVPLEACGLLGGTVEGDAATVGSWFPCDNEAASAKVYAIGGRDFMRADRAAEDAGQQLIGVVHSHTHTDAWPSPTDIAAAPDPGWHYVIVSLRDIEPTVRSFRIIDGTVREEPVVVTPR